MPPKLELTRGLGLASLRRAAVTLPRRQRGMPATQAAPQEPHDVQDDEEDLHRDSQADTFTNALQHYSRMQSEARETRSQSKSQEAYDTTMPDFADDDDDIMPGIEEAAGDGDGDVMGAGEADDVVVADEGDDDEGLLDLNEMDPEQIEDILDILPIDAVHNMQQAAEYQERALEDDDDDAGDVAFDENIGEEDGALSEAESTVLSTIFVGGRPVPQAAPFAPDVMEQAMLTDEEARAPSTLIHFYQNQHERLSEFEMSLGLMAHLSGMSRKDYDAWRQILGLLRGRDGKPLPEIQNLPKQLATLKTRVTRRLPLIDMREAKVTLNLAKLSTETASRKRELAAKGKQKEEDMGDDEGDHESSTDSADVITSVKTPLYFLDPESLYRAFLQTETAARMHRGLGHFVDEPTELHQAPCWLGSVRSTSGEYAHVDGRAIFPSDYVFYRCGDNACWCMERGRRPEDCHLGRVAAVGLDYLVDEDGVQGSGEILLRVERCYDSSQLPESLQIDPPLKAKELVLAPAELEYVQEFNVLRIADVTVDVYWGETMSDPSPGVLAKDRRKFDKYSRNPPPVPIGKDGFVRRWIGWDDETLYPMAHNHPIRGELELKTYGREYFEQFWDTKVVQYDVLSCPVHTFIDGFGLYKNSYRSLMGVYQAPLLDLDERQRNSNIFPIMLGPHGADFDELFDALKCMLPLDKGIMMVINGRNTLVCVHTSCFIGDMPQQDKNTGTIGPTGLKFCRNCHIGEEHRLGGDVLEEFDIISNGRYHYQHIQMRYEMDIALTSKTKKKQYGTTWGLSIQRPAATKISPCLDIIQTRAPDGAHYEYKALSGVYHRLLINNLLTPKARREYARILRLWPFPPGWPKLQSPLHHIDSYDLSAHARWSIIVPGLLRGWLEPGHLDPYVLAAMKKLYAWNNIRVRAGPEDDGDVDDPQPGSEEFKRWELCMVQVVVAAFASLAQSNSVLMGRKITTKQRENLMDIALKPREKYLMLVKVCAQAIEDNPRAAIPRKSKSQPAAQAEAADAAAEETAEEAMEEASEAAEAEGAEDAEVAEDTAEGEEDAETAAKRAAAKAAREKRAKKLLATTVRPTQHAGVHWPEVAHEYGSPVHVNTLPYERGHSFFKNRTMQTNHRDIEKHLLLKANLQQTVRFALTGAYRIDDPKLTTMMLRLQESCPALFEHILPREDKKQTDLDIQERELDIDDAADATHLNPSVSSKIVQSVVQKVKHSVCDKDRFGKALTGGWGGGVERTTLPVRSSHMSTAFKTHLRAAYKDYDVSAIISFGPSAIQYARQVAFSDQKQYRYVFRPGDHIEYHGSKLGRIDHIFTHDHDGQRRIFLILTAMRVRKAMDEVLEQHLVKDTGLPVIIGLGAVSFTRPYVINVAQGGDDPDLVRIDWECFWQ